MDSLEKKVEQMVSEGVDIFDIGAYSTRLGADDVSPEEELRRLQRGMEVVKRMAPNIPVSIDTFRANVARTCVEEMGADIVNDEMCIRDSSTTLLWAQAWVCASIWICSCFVPTWVSAFTPPTIQARAATSTCQVSKTASASTSPSATHSKCPYGEKMLP